MINVVSPLEALLNIWNESEINYCIWKGVNKIENAFKGDEDLDILVSKKDLYNAEKLASQYGFIKVNSPNYKADVAVEDFIFLSEEGKWYHLHVHYLAIFGNGVIRDYHIPLEEYLISKSILHDMYNVKVISPEDDLCFFLLRHLVRKSKLLGYVDFYNELIELIDYYQVENIVFNNSDIFPKEIPEYLKLKNKSKSSIKILRKKILKKMSYNRQINDAQYFWDIVFNTVNHVLSKTLGKYCPGTLGRKRSLNNGGRLIAFIGIDGSGKSSAIERLEKVLGKQLNFSSVSLGSGVSGASWYRKLAFKVFGNKAKFKGHADLRQNDRTKKTKKNYPWYYKLWLIICLIDKKRELQKSSTQKSRGNVVLSDRWLQNQLAGKLDGTRTSNMKIKGMFSQTLVDLESDVFEAANRNKPDVIVRFDVSPENSVLRKPNDLNLEQATSANIILDSICWGGIVVARVDANKNTTEVDRQLLSIISKILN